MTSLRGPVRPANTQDGSVDFDTTERLTTRQWVTCPEASETSTTAPGSTW